MKHTLLALIMFVMIPFMSKADNTLVIKNNTGEVIYTSIVWYNKGRQFWESKGWFKIPAYGQFTQQLSELGLGDNLMYVCAKDGDVKSNGQAKFRVDPVNAFDIFYADKFDSKAQTMNFTSVMVHQGETVFTFGEH